MKELWILYSSKFDTGAENASTRMLKVALDKGVNAKLFFYDLFLIENNELYYKGEKVEVLPTIVFIRGHDLVLVGYFETHNVRVINTSFAIANCRDKWATKEIVDSVKVNQPKTYLLANLKFEEIIKLVGLPFILKYRSGSHGANIYLIKDEAHYEDIRSTINSSEYMVQEFIASSIRKDLRVYIIGGKVIGAVIRKNEEGFMSNIAQGGLSYNYQIDEETKAKSIMIARALKGDIISVDYLFGPNGLLFCEANTNAGFSSFIYLKYPMRELMVDYLKKELCK